MSLDSISDVGPAFQAARYLDYAAVIAEGIFTNPPTGEFWVLDLPNSRVRKGGEPSVCATLALEPGEAARVALRVWRRGDEWVYRHPVKGEVVAGRQQTHSDWVGIPSSIGRCAPVSVHINRRFGGRLIT